MYIYIYCCYYFLSYFFAFPLESRDGAVVRALASHQCGPGLILGLGVICGLSLLLVLVLAPRVFSPGTPVFPPSSKTNISKFQFAGNSRATGLSVAHDC